MRRIDKKIWEIVLQIQFSLIKLKVFFNQKEKSNEYAYYNIKYMIR